jgi:hypothetical protein
MRLSELPTWAKELLHAAYTLSFVIVITVSLVMGIYVVPWWLGLDGVAGRAVGFTLFAGGIFGYGWVTRVSGMDRLVQLGHEAKVERTRVRILKLLERAAMGDAAATKKARRALKRCRLYVGKPDELVELEARIDEADSHLS